MDYLYIVVLSLSLIMLIVFLIVFGAMLYTKQEVNPFPPVPNTCPDFWPEINGSCLYLPEGIEDYTENGLETDPDKREKLAFINDTKIFSGAGRNNGSLKNFMTLLDSRVNDPIDSGHYVWKIDPYTFGLRFNESATLCDKRKWANKYGIKWDGVSNYNHC